MGGHWGTSSGASNGSAVRAGAVADALENWQYSTTPTDRDAVAGRLSAAFPDATVRRGDSATAHDVVVDDVGVIVAHRLDPAFRRDVHALADRFDAVVVYSTNCHTAMPNAWREFKHRHRGRTAGARIRFVHRSDSSEAGGPSSRRALATITAALLAIGGLLTASLGLFGADTTALAGSSAATATTVGALLLGALAVLVVGRRRVSIALIKRLPHT